MIMAKQRKVIYTAPKKAGEQKETKTPDLSVLNGWYETSKGWHRKKHWEWFVIDQFLRGNHDIRGNPNDNTIEIVRKSQSINYPINKVYAVFRAVRAFVTRHKPFVQVEPENSSEEAKAYARRANKTLERDNQLNNFRKINKEWVYYGVKYGVGYRQIGYDTAKNVCIRWTVDPFDMLIGSKYGELEDAPYVIKTFIRTIGYLKKRFPKKESEISPDNELAADEYKKMSLQIQYSNEGIDMNRVDEQTKICKEAWYRVYEPNKAGGLINKVVYTDVTILDFEETPYTEYPFIAYKSDVVPHESSGEGHIKHVLSPQRMLNLLNTQLLEYNHLINKGRFLKDKNAGFRVITSREGQIIEKNPGKQVQVLNPPGVNPTLQWQIGFANESIETLGGQHDASMGATPQRVSSGDAIEALQLGDSNNISDLRDNFEDALALEAQWILKMYSLFENDGIVLNNELKDGSEETFAVLGSEARKDNMPDKYFMEDNGAYCDVCAVLPDNQVKVSVTSQLGETKQARMNLMMELVKLGLPFKVLLDHLEFPNASDIMERIASESLGDIAMQQIQGAPPMGEEGGEPPPPPAEDVEAELAALNSEV